MAWGDLRFHGAQGLAEGMLCEGQCQAVPGSPEDNPPAVCCCFADVGEPAAGGKRRALPALPRAVHGLRATLLEVTLGLPGPA